MNSAVGLPRHIDRNTSLSVINSHKLQFLLFMCLNHTIKLVEILYGVGHRPSVLSNIPGVSIKLILCLFQKKVIAADVIVIPRSLSCSM